MVTILSNWKVFPMCCNICFKEGRVSIPFCFSFFFWFFCLQNLACYKIVMLHSAIRLDKPAIPILFTNPNTFMYISSVVSAESYIIMPIIYFPAIFLTCSFLRKQWDELNTFLFLWFMVLKLIHTSTFVSKCDTKNKTFSSSGYIKAYFFMRNVTVNGLKHKYLQETWNLDSRRLY